MLFSALFRRNIAEFDDETLAQKAGKGNQHALGELFRRYGSLVFGVSLKYLKNKNDADDMVMQVFEKLMEKLAKHKVDNFSSWLHTLTRNECLMLLRKKKRPTTDIEKALIQKEDAGAAELDEKIAKEGLLSALETKINTLKPDQKKAIELFFIQNKCYDEVSSLMNVDLKKVKSLIQNGKRNLKIAMGTD
jgi:RNA polymerase sigma-70 factor (ECF subfamily)